MIGTGFVLGKLLQFSWLDHQKAGKKLDKDIFGKNFFLKENVFIIDIIYYEDFEKRSRFGFYLKVSDQNFSLAAKLNCLILFNFKKSRMKNYSSCYKKKNNRRSKNQNKENKTKQRTKQQNRYKAVKKVKENWGKSNIAKVFNLEIF